MKKMSILGICIIALVALATWAPDASAYSNFNGGCDSCHGAFRDSAIIYTSKTLQDPVSWGSDLHSAHQDMVSPNCTPCHPASGFNNPPIGGPSGDGFNSCMGCHGRDQDINNMGQGPGRGAGLRQHHWVNGITTTCSGCHPDSDPTAFTPVGEDVPGARNAALGIDPCNDVVFGVFGSDNDGDNLYDGDDPDCAAPECTVDGECDDGFFCTGVEICDAGTCVTGTPPSCDDGVVCTVDTCDVTSDACMNTPDDASCDDNNVCTGSETCDPVNGCQAGTPLDCDDGELCTTDSCVPLTGCANDAVQCPAGEQCDSADGICKPVPECTVDADCDNGFFCDGAETCDAAGICQPGTPVDCDDGVGCTVDTCDETIDACVNTPDDASCDDNNVCTGIETCDPVNGCQAGTPLNCDDGELCTTDSCVPLTGCANDAVQCPAGEQCDSADGICKPVPECTVDADCDNGFFCDGAETCDAAGICQPGTPVDCDDGVGCTVDTCDETSDTCANTPDDASCDDGDVCNGSETCDPVNDCQAGTPLNCDDGDFCTNDSCDPVAGCVFTPVECTAGEQCDPADGICKAEPECTVDADCDDAMFCNGAETCDTATGICQAGTPVDCDDGVDCTVDTCDELDDTCVNTPDDIACPDDGLFCTGDEICDSAVGCVSTGDPCPEGMTCNEDTDTCDMVGKVTICHIPPGKHAKARTLSVNAKAVPAHLRHGDSLGSCQ